jgi:hypothetical protein
MLLSFVLVTLVHPVQPVSEAERLADAAAEGAPA